YTEEKLGQAEKTELDAHFESLLARADCTKNWTEKIYRQTEVLLQPNPSARIEEFLYEKLDRKIPYRATNGEILGQYMLEAAKEFGPGTPYGSTLIQVGDCQRRLGGAEREFLQTSSISFLTPLRNFLEGDWRTITKERRLLENRRLDLDACKARLKKAKAAEAKAAVSSSVLLLSAPESALFSLCSTFLWPRLTLCNPLSLFQTVQCEGEAVPDFQETRPRNYVLSASASAVRDGLGTPTPVQSVSMLRAKRRESLEFERGMIGVTPALMSIVVLPRLFSDCVVTLYDVARGLLHYNISTIDTCVYLSGPVAITSLSVLFFSMFADQLWSEEVEKAEQELRMAQTEFDRQAEVTRLLLEGISSTHVNHLRCLHEFVEAQATYYSQCHHFMQELQKDLSRWEFYRRYPNSFVVSTGSVRSPSADPSTAVPINSLSPETEALQIEEVQPPASGTRKAKVLYDYDAADTSELSLLADEVRGVLLIEQPRPCPHVAGAVKSSQTSRPLYNPPTVNPKANRKANRKANPKANRKANPKANCKANRKANPKANCEANRKANPKANRKANPKANRKANPKANSHYGVHSARHGLRLADWRAGESEREGARHVPGAFKLKKLQSIHTSIPSELEHPHTVPADGAVGVEVEGHQVFWTCDDKPFILVLTTVPPHTDSLGVSTKTKAGLVTEDDPLPF
ncbi:hypothetical protein NFI96_028470, partial [Prochilodus magdalenae]